MASKSLDNIVTTRRFRFNETATGYKVLMIDIYTYI